MISLQKALDPDGFMGKFVQTLNKEIPKPKLHQEFGNVVNFPVDYPKVSITWFWISTKDNRRTEPQFHEIGQFLPEQVLAWKQSLPLMTLSPCTHHGCPQLLRTPTSSPHSMSKLTLSTPLSVFASSIPQAPCPPHEWAARNCQCRGIVPLIRSLVLTSVLSCQLLANYFPCQNNYWERKDNFPSNHFSPSSSSPRPCLAVFHSTSPRHTQKSDRWRSEQLWLTHKRPWLFPVLWALSLPGVRWKTRKARSGCFWNLQGVGGDYNKTGQGLIITIRNIIQSGNTKKKKKVKCQIQLFLR